MTTISSHILDSTTGCDAGGIRVICHRLSASGQVQPVFDTKADESGRISIDIDRGDDSADARYELIFYSGDYFAGTQGSMVAQSAITEVVVRIDLARASERFHVPVLIAPHNHTLWWSR